MWRDLGFGWGKWKLGFLLVFWVRFGRTKEKIIKPKGFNSFNYWI